METDKCGVGLCRIKMKIYQDFQNCIEKIRMSRSFKLLIGVALLTFLFEYNYGLIVVGNRLQDETFSFPDRVVTTTSIQQYKRGILCYPDDMPDEPCQNSRLASDPIHSKIWLMGRKQYIVGDGIRLKLKSYDGLNRPKSVGGDHIRPRMYSNEMNASAAGIVIDNLDGTYDVIFKAFWAGDVKIEVELLYPKEVLAAVYRTRNEEIISVCGSKRDIVAEMRDKVCVLKNISTPRSEYTDEEKTDCHFEVQARLPGYTYYCFNPNVTATYDCIKWKKDVRSCWSYDHKLSKCEEDLAARRNFTVGGIIEIQVKPSNTHKQIIDSPDLPCTKYNTTHLWFKEDPVGFFYDDIWYLGHCKGGTTHFGRCLSGKTLVFHGDSTLHHWTNYIRQNYDLDFKCNVLQKGKTPKFDYQDWSDTNLCVSSKYNFTFVWIPPVNKVADDNSSYIYMDTIMSALKEVDRRVPLIMVSHLYLHYDLEKFNRYQVLMRSIKAIYKRLIEEFESVQLFFKAPHTHRPYDLELFELNKMIEGPDYVSYIFTCIMKHVFKDMYDKVIILDQKDATVCTKNVKSHPGPSVVGAMVKQFMNYVCD